MLYVIYNDSDVLIVQQDEAFEKMVSGWFLYGVSDNEENAEKLAEEACI